MPNVPRTFAEFALAFVDKLVPSSFVEAEAWLSPNCRYYYDGRILQGPEVLDAFKDSHARAERDLDQIDYLPAEILESLPDGALVGVKDLISVNGKTHLYRDRLLVRVGNQSGLLLVQEIRHLPIADERELLKAFLASAGPR